MKKTIPILAALMLTACGGGYQRIGSLTMLSTRNVDRSQTYELLARNVEGRAKSKQDNTLQQATDEAVGRIAGGEYMMNVAVMVGRKGERVKVVGDVWGVKLGSAQEASAVVTGSAAMKVGDAVLYTPRRKNDKVKAAPITGTIVALRQTTAMIEYRRVTGSVVREVPLAELTVVR